MEQRRLRLGDILDDYCPRERRVTNHAVVAMIEDTVKQTRCTTCDAEHPYKGGAAPRRRKKETPAALYKEVLSGLSDGNAAPAVAASSPTLNVPDSETAAPEELLHEDVSDPDLSLSPEPDREGESPASSTDEGPVHRPLIRATLPRPEGQKDARPLPEFTVRHSGGRGNGNFRGDSRGRQRGGPGANGHRPHGGNRFAGPRSGSGRGPGGRGGAFRSSQGPRHGGKKRSR
jgi:hypothetical protein